MAFLDNSGDIILDATLTETGRKRMAQGRFRIAKYALGDDEIDYSLYNKNHPSGSAYFDLKILQTPVFEAFTTETTNINFGLLSNTRMDLLYLPIITVNNKVPGCIDTYPLTRTYHVAVNNETYTQLESVWGTDASKYALLSGDRTRNFVAFEGGLNTSDFLATATTRQNYLKNTRLIDRELTISTDSRFIAGVMGTKPAGRFSNRSDGSLVVNLLPTDTPTSGRRTRDYAYYRNSVINAIPNLLFFHPGGTSDTAYSTLEGPRSFLATLGFSVQAELTSLSTGVRSALWGQFGETGQAVFGGSPLFDYIDTTVYLQGNRSTARTQIQVRIIRYAGT